MVAAWTVVPAAASAETLEDGVYTADPGAHNTLQVAYEPDRDTYVFLGAFPDSDADGPGGCGIVEFRARCPAAGLDRIVLNMGDGNDNVTIASGGYGPPIGFIIPGISDANQVRIPVIVKGGPGNDVIGGGWGRDVLDGGPGIDLIAGWESSYSGLKGDARAQAPDLLECGSGNDGFASNRPGPPANGFIDIDSAEMGERDRVTTNCEFTRQFFTCPKSGPACVGIAPIEATVPAAGSASASASGGRKRTVVLGQGKFDLRPGHLGIIQTRVNVKRARRVIPGHGSVPARSSLLGRQKQSKQRKLLGRTKFRMKKR